MLTFLEMSYAWSAWIQRWGLSAILWIFTASLTHAAQPLPQELMNQWFAVEVLSGARIPLSIEFAPSPWSLIRLRLAPDERLLVLFNAPVQDGPEPAQHFLTVASFRSSRGLKTCAAEGPAFNATSICLGLQL